MPPCTNPPDPHPLGLEHQLSLGHGGCIQDVVDDVAQVVGGILDSLDVVQTLLAQLPGAGTQQGL